VFGVGFDFYNDGDSIDDPGTVVQYSVFVTYGDKSTQNFLLPIVSASSLTPGYFGITSDLGIVSIHLGLADGASTMDGSFAIDNLTIGSAPTVPLPSAVWLFGTGLIGLTGLKRNCKLVRA
jgi:hypothetical protein